MKRFQLLTSLMMYSICHCCNPNDEELRNSFDSKSSKAVLHFIDNWFDAGKKYITVVQPNYILINHASIFKLVKMIRNGTAKNSYIRIAFNVTNQKKKIFFRKNFFGFHLKLTITTLHNIAMNCLVQTRLGKRTFYFMSKRRKKLTSSSESIT